MKRERLNNKGFTLIELLAVVVILAVVMGIATTSVLSAMNKSRAGALADSAMVVVNGFNQKYTESLVDGVPTNVYLDELKLANPNVTTGYDFSKGGVHYLTKDLSDALKLSDTTYRLSGAVEPVNADAKGVYSVAKSFVSYNETTQKFVVCLVAKNTGNNYVAANALTYGDTKLQPTINGMKFNFVKDVDETTVMYACSDGTRSW